jgi:hypothetical protein
MIIGARSVLLASALLVLPGLNACLKKAEQTSEFRVTDNSFNPLDSILGEKLLDDGKTIRPANFDA